jgi:hypothetical protein
LRQTRVRLDAQVAHRFGDSVGRYLAQRLILDLIGLRLAPEASWFPRFSVEVLEMRLS